MDTQAPELTAEQLVDLQVPQDVRISPSGKYCIYVCKPIAKKDEHAVSSLWLAELGKEHSARQLTSGLSSDSSPRWCPDTSKGESVAFISDRAKHGESSAIYLLSLSGGEAYAVTKADNKKEIAVFKWSPNGQFIAYVSSEEESEAEKAREKETGETRVYGEDWEFGRLRVLHVATREVSTIVTGDVHVKDFAWSEDSKEIAHITQETPEISSAGYHGVKFSKASLATKKGDILGEKFPGPAHDLAWSGDNLFFLAGTTPDKCCTSSCIHKMSASSGHWDKHYEGKASEVTCVESLRSFAHGSNQLIAAQILDGLTDHIQILSQGSSNVANEDICTTPKIGHEIQTWPAATWDISCIPRNSDRIAKVIGYSTISEPAEIYSIEEDGIFCQLSSHGQAVAKLNIGEAEPIYCKAPDGTGCDGFFVHPTTGGKGKPLPTVVLIHGGPYARISISFNVLYFYWGPILTAAGYGILCPNYRGGSGHGESYAAQARGGLGTTDYEDVITLVKEGVDKGLIDADKVVIGGYSQGGFLSYHAVARSSFTFRGAICGGGISDPDMLTMTSDAPWFESEIAGSAPWTSKPDDTRSRHGGAIWRMENVKTPILILHGEKDERVPLTQAVAFHRGCLHYGVPCEFVTYPREGHVIGERAHVVDMLKRIRRFVDSHLK